MPIIQVEEVSSAARWDAEHYANEYRGFLDRMFTGWQEWVDLADAADEKIRSGETPANHDLDDGDAALVTVECVDPLFLDPSKLKRVTVGHVEGQLRRARVEKGDVLITIKRRLVNSSPVLVVDEPTAVNQDVVVMRPRPVFKPGFVAAALNSRIGKYQAFRNATEQINPYLSVKALGRLRLPIVGEAEQRQIDDLVTQRLEALATALALELRAREHLAGALQLPDRRVTRLTTVASSNTLSAENRFDAEYFCVPDITVVWRSPYPIVPLADARASSYINNGQTPAASDYANDGVPVLKVGDVTAFAAIDWRGSRVRTDAPAAKGAKGAAESGDVVMLAAAHFVGYIGKSGMVREKPAGEKTCRSVGELITIRPGSELSPETLVSYFNLTPVRQQIQRLVRGQSAHLYPSDLRELAVPLVDPRIQHELKTLLDEADARRREAHSYMSQAIRRVEVAVLGPAC